MHYFYLPAVCLKYICVLKLKYNINVSLAYHSDKY